MVVAVLKLVFHVNDLRVDVSKTTWLLLVCRKWLTSVISIVELDQLKDWCSQHILLFVMILSHSSSNSEIRITIFVWYADVVIRHQKAKNTAHYFLGWQQTCDLVFSL